MIKDSSKLKKGQCLTVNLDKVRDRLPKALFKRLKKHPHGELVGFKMVDGNQFGLVLKLDCGSSQWFFEEELSDIDPLSN